MTERFKTLATSQWAYFVYGVLLAALVILGIRFAAAQAPEETHYHANFAVYIDGKKAAFKGAQYYEEVALCNLHDTMTPKARTHMHNEENGVVHVHHDGVTWGQFFENLGWLVGPDFIRTNERLYVADEVNELHIVLNGQNLTNLTSITNELIGDKDRLLLSYGEADDTTLDEQYKNVLSNADVYNNKQDPAGCAGAHQITFKDRLDNLF